MHRQLTLERDEIEDELELQDEELRKQMADGYQAYLRGETRGLDQVIAELRNDLNPRATKAK